VTWTEASELFEGVDQGLRRYLRADILASKGDFSSAETTLGSCIVDGDSDVWCELLKLVYALDRDSLDGYALSGDLLQLTLHLASHPEIRGSAASRAFLAYSESLEFDAEIAYPQSVKGLRISDQSKWEDFEIQIFPNPARDELNVLFSNGINEEVSSLEISDIQGRVVFRSIGPHNALWSLDVRALSAGSYIMNIFSDDRIRYTSPLQIVK
jgi:hypothetical protein